MINSYRDLDVWRVSMDLAEAVYLATRIFPREELFGLSSQMRRSSSSVPANIAEGHGREHTAEFTRFLRIAQGSLKETETHVILAQRLGLLAAADADRLLELADRIGRMTRALIRSLDKPE